MAKAKKRARARMNLPICLAGVLFCLTLFSFHLSSGVVARYSATSSGSDSARVIKFEELSLVLDEGDNQYIYPGAKLKCNPKVSFGGSESATYVFVEVSGVHDIQATGIAPVEIKNKKDGAISLWMVGDGWSLLKTERENGNSYGVYCYNGGKPLEPNSTALKDGVAFFQKDVCTIQNNVTAEQIGSMTYNPTFRAYAVQANGFEDANDAWDSLVENGHVTTD